MSILFLSSGMPGMAAVMIFAAGLFDFFDGFFARLLNAHSPIGADLDSLSDVVSFGVAPGFIMYYFMKLAIVEPIIPVGEFDLFPCLAFMLPVFSALRLARFNIDTRQSTSFIGIPAPGMAILVASLPLAFWQMNVLDKPILNLYFCLAIVIFLSFLMISKLPFFSFKMKSLTWKGNEVRWSFLIVAIIAFSVMQCVGLPFIMLIYILFSLLFAREKY
jgi:Phosphatidylserine synthase